MAKKRKYYVVWEGHETGVFDSWTQAQLQVKGYPNAKYKSFSSREEAEEAFALGEAPTIKKGTSKPAVDKYSDDIVKPSISVDAACSGNPGLMEYRGVWTEGAVEIFHQGPFAQGTNNVGEFLALVHALALLKQKGDASTPIYTDSRIAMGWVKRKKANTKLKRTRANAQLFQLVARAEQWLKSNDYSTKIMKWDTRAWGEIPADFGRK